MPYAIASRRASPASLQRHFGNAPRIDVTSKGPQPWVRFSPFYPHGDIPVPLSPGYTAASVEGIWQALKVFAQADIDRTKLTNTSMRGLKRSARSLGPVRGHRADIDGVELLDYETNIDLDNLTRPLSHAGLIMHYLNGTWPDKVDASQANKGADRAPEHM